MMKKRLFAFWLALILLPLPGIAHADDCAVCAGAGYVSRPVFGTGEMVFVNCPACGGTAVSPEETPLPEENAHADSSVLPDPGKYANYTDQCVYAELDYAVFECEMGYDIDRYISDLTKNTGLKIINRYDFEEGDIRYYQLAVSEEAQACHASVFYHVDGRISLSVKDSACVHLPDRAEEVLLFTWEPEKKSLQLPDVSGFAQGEVSVREWTPNRIAYDCGENFDFDGYLDVLRYEYGFDVEAVVQDHNEKTTRYALYNPDLNEKTMKIGDATDIDKAKRHLEITYSSFNYLYIQKAGGSEIKLANDKKIEPNPTPNPDPDPNPDYNPDPDPRPNPNPSESDCSMCGGSGKRNCLGCSGKGYNTCGGCNGSGDRRCGSCNGTGTKGSGRCSTCYGSGKRDCSSCSGSGKRECSSCSGTGKDRCSSCGGSGKR